MTRRLAIAFSAMVLLILAACGGAATGSSAAQSAEGAATAAPDGGDGGGTEGSFDLCSVLSTDEVGEAVDLEVTEATSANSSGVLSCNYLTADGAPIAGTTLTTPEAGVDASAMYDANVGAAGAEEISGVGDRSVLVGSDSFPILFALKGDSLYALSVLADNLDAAGKRQAAIDLATLSVARLP